MWQAHICTQLQRGASLRATAAAAAALHFGAAERARLPALREPLRDALLVEVVPARQAHDAVLRLEGRQADAAVVTLEFLEVRLGKISHAVGARGGLRDHLVESEEEVVVLWRDVSGEQAVDLGRRQAAGQSEVWVHVCSSVAPAPAVAPALRALAAAVVVAVAVAVAAAVAMAVTSRGLLVPVRLPIPLRAAPGPPVCVRPPVRVRLVVVVACVAGVAVWPVAGAHGLLRRRDAPGRGRHGLAAPPAPGPRVVGIVRPIGHPGDDVRAEPVERQAAVGPPLPELPALVPLDRELALAARVGPPHTEAFDDVLLVGAVDVKPGALEVAERPREALPGGHLPGPRLTRTPGSHGSSHWASAALSSSAGANSAPAPAVQAAAAAFK
mmetsp:Transcript_32062/g.95376  ORF Transcript_32062/g.95376 Transcript_32062/m.95376 type:complete len:384 (-) Transcript_32062:14-1165(-)